MEFLLEIIFDLIVEGSVEVVKSRKVSKWIRYPVVALISLFIIAIIGFLTFIGFSLIAKEDRYAKLGGLICLIFDIIIIIFIIRNIRKQMKIKRELQVSQEDEKI